VSDPKTPSKAVQRQTVYEISKLRAGTAKTATAPPNAAAMTSASTPTHGLSWEPVGTIETNRGATAAIRQWAEDQGEKFAGGAIRAVPKSMVTTVMVAVETRRQLTLGAP
jgi:hypothetical protein